MLKERARLIERLLFVLDLALTAAAFVGAYWIRGFYSSPYLPRLVYSHQYVYLFLLVIPVWAALLKYFQVYRSYRTSALYQEILVLAKVVAAGGFILGCALFFFKHQMTSRVFLVCFLAVDILLLGASRIFIRTTSHFLRRRGYNTRNLLLVGEDRRVLEFAEMIRHSPRWGIKVLGLVTLDREVPPELRTCGCRVLGQVSQLPRMVTEMVVDEVVFMVSRHKLDELEDLFLFLEEVGINTRVALNFFPHVSARASISNLGQVPMISFSTVSNDGFALILKEVMDRCLSLVLLVLVAPLMLVISLVLVFAGRRPVLIHQIRCGLHGRKFPLYRFNSGSGVLGRWLKKTGLEHLPQLFNVLKGHMSLVGPRPSLPREVERYERWQLRRLSMKPGITCLWRVENRRRMDLIERIRLDLEYIDSWRLKLDFKILLKTIPVVLSG